MSSRFMSIALPFRTTSGQSRGRIGFVRVRSASFGGPILYYQLLNGFVRKKKIVLFCAFSGLSHALEPLLERVWRTFADAQNGMFRARPRAATRVGALIGAAPIQLPCPQTMSTFFLIVSASHRQRSVEYLCMISHKLTMSSSSALMSARRLTGIPARHTLPASSKLTQQALRRGRFPPAC